ncbi:MAG: MopE-related protein [Myxococcota bacterium]
MLLTLVLACTTRDTPPTGPDGDGDGYEASRDCDDGDPAVYPGAPERCDGIPNDCDDADVDEAGLVSLEDGGWGDLTALWAAGAPGDPAVLAMPDSGVVHICPGRWYVHLISSGGVTELRGQGTTEDIVLDGSGEGSVIVGSDTDLTVTNVTLTGGIGSGDPYTYGGALYQVGGTLTLDQVVVRDNAATESGGGIYAWGTSVTLVDSVFDGNQAGDRGGGAYVTDTNTTGRVQHVSASVSGCSFTGNSAGSDGGGLAFDVDGGTASSLSVEGGEFAANDGEYGGGVWLFGTAVEVVIDSDTSFSGNFGDVDGGGLYFASDGSIDVQAVFMDNSASRGGGMFASNLAAILDAEIRGSTFERNHAAVGGAVGVQCGEGPGVVLVHGAALERNTASAEGGAIRAYGCELIVENSAFMSNSSERTGGAFQANEATVTLSAVTLDGNEAALSGGAARLTGTHLQCGNNSTFHGNAAGDHGGGAYIVDSSFVSDACNFGELGTVQDNTAGGQPDDVFGVEFEVAGVFGEDASITCDQAGCE